MSTQSQNEGCLGSSHNRWQLLSSQENRNEALGQIKHLLRGIDIELSNKLMPLIYEIYLDAQYKERTNLQMKEIIIELQNKVKVLENQKKTCPETPIDLFRGKRKHEKYQESPHDPNILEAYQRIDILTSTLERVEKENAELRNEIATSTMDQQTEILIQNLTLQLQNQKNKNKQLELRSISLQQELNELSQMLREKQSLMQRQREVNC